MKALQIPLLTVGSARFGVFVASARCLVGGKRRECEIADSGVVRKNKKGDKQIFVESGEVLGDHKHPTSQTGIFSSLKISFGTITDMQHKYCGNCYDIYLIQSQYTKVAAFGRHHKRGGGLRLPPLLWFPLYWLWIR